jgi:hypothetical protein
VKRLVDDQLDDGSWESAPILRVTNRECTTPWECANAGPTYADEDRLFTSATAVTAVVQHVA